MKEKNEELTKLKVRLRELERESGESRRKLEQLELYHRDECMNPRVTGCAQCGIFDCIYFDPMHYNRTGCPSCMRQYEDEHEEEAGFRAESEAARARGGRRGGAPTSGGGPKRSSTETDVNMDGQEKEKEKVKDEEGTENGKEEEGKGDTAAMSTEGTTEDVQLSPGDQALLKEVNNP